MSAVLEAAAVTTESNPDVDMHLAFRTEGQLFNAYIEHAGKRPFVQLVGSINADMCKDDHDSYLQWRGLMALIVSRMCERRTGEPAHFVNMRLVPRGGRA
jgi:hypothetical protein